jgi:16S rRNA processing protein RimM
MNPDDFFLFGKIIKSSGTSGELILIANERIPAFNKMESVFIRFSGNLVPFFIERTREKSADSWGVKFLDVNTPDEWSPLIGGEVLLPVRLKPRKKRGRKFDIDLNLNGYKIIDNKVGEVGVIQEILEMPMQELLRVDHAGKEVLIPLVEEFVESVDNRKKILYLHLPDGLLEI